MSGSLFDELEVTEDLFTLPSGKEIKLYPLNIYQRLDINDDLQKLRNREAKKGDMIDICKKTIQLSVLNENYEPYLSERDLNRLAVIQGGNLITKMFGRVMDISGATNEAWNDAGKKSETRE